MKVSIKRILVIILVAMLAFAALKSQKIKKFFVEERYRSVIASFPLTNKCYSPQPDLLFVMEQNNIDYVKADKMVVSKSAKRIVNLSEKSHFKIPAVSHHVYFTYDDNPIKLKDFFIEKMKANYNKLNATKEDWQHYIWTNDITLFPKEIKDIKGVKVMNLKSFEGHELYHSLSEAVKKGNDLRAYFMQASDMLRLMALQKFGGVYNDMDYEIYNAKALTKLMRNFDFIGGREPLGEFSYYGNAFMAAKPNHPVINYAVSKLIDYNNGNIPKYMRYPCNLFEKLYFTSPPLLTISYLKSSNLERNSDIILPAWMIYNVDFAREKNRGCTFVNMSREEFQQKNETLNNLIELFTLISQKKNQNEDITDIYYSSDGVKDREKFPVIGADMFCASWYESRK
jgi:hypothetical protein